MTELSPESLVQQFGERRLIAVVRANSARDAVEAARALSRGGVTVIEVAFTNPGAAEALAELAHEAAGDVLVGAGTVIGAADAEAALDAGAAFLVSPFLCDEVLDLAKRRGALAIPGVLTPTEIAAAASSPLLKLFPGSIGGPAMLRTLRGPFPSVRFVPTGGVDLGSLSAWFAAGAYAVGAGSDLCPAQAVAARDHQELERRARAYVAELTTISQGSVSHCDESGPDR